MNVRAPPFRSLSMEAVLRVAPAPRAIPDSEGSGLLLSGISKAWRGRPVLDGVSLGLEPGSLTLVAGANGAGKTTLLRIACGLVAPDAGSVAFDGLRPRRDRRAFHRRLGLLSAGDRGIYARLTVHHHLELCARLALLADEEVGAAIEHVVRLVGIEELLPHRVDRLSMGQRQRLRIALTFLHSPSLVLLDEPLTSLDEEGAAGLRRCIAGVLERAGVVVWCSPVTDAAAAPFTRRLWLEDGSLRDVS
jgi:ABC-type multidrug transport system ATPase subunit